MFITGPDVIKTVTHEEVTQGRPRRRARRTTHERRRALRRARATSTASRSIRELLSFLPSNNHEDPPLRRDAAIRSTARSPELDTIVPTEPNKPYDMQEIIMRASSTTGTSSRCTRRYAMNIVVGFARIGGRTVGIVANQPQVLAGCLDIDASHQGRALRALLRLLQHPARHLRRRARLPARHRPGVRRHHQARREAALRVRRGDGAEGHGHHAQGLRRRVRRDGVEAHPRATSTSPSRPRRSR